MLNRNRIYIYTLNYMYLLNPAFGGYVETRHSSTFSTLSTVKHVQHELKHNFILLNLYKLTHIGNLGFIYCRVNNHPTHHRKQTCQCTVQYIQQSIHIIFNFPLSRKKLFAVLFGSFTVGSVSDHRS